MGSDDAAHDGLERLARRYLTAYGSRDPSGVRIADGAVFTENNVVLRFPDGSWDAITEEVGPALVFSDPATGCAAVFTAIRMIDTPAFLAIRLRVRDGEIVEMEHLLSTRRAVSGPPTPFGNVEDLAHQPVVSARVPDAERLARAELIEIADGYFKTLSRNDGTLHAKFAETCYRIENGYQAAPKGAAADFLLGRYRFNERVRREWIMVDESRAICMARGFIDHKGLMGTYELTDGSLRESPFREPHTWSFLEMFKIEGGRIAAVEANFIGSPYFTDSPWTTSAQITDLDDTWNSEAVHLKDRRYPGSRGH